MAWVRARSIEQKEQRVAEIVDPTARLYEKHDFVQWRKEVVDTFQNQHHSIMEFSTLWVDIQIRHKRMIELLTILFTTLEKNSSLQSLISYKKNTQEEFELIAEVLMDILPSITQETMYQFLFAQLAMAIGTYPMLNLTEAQKEAMDTVGMISDPQFFRTIYSRSIEYLIQGFLLK